MDTSKVTSDFAPLLKALEKVESNLELQRKTEIIVARENQKLFKRQELKQHNKVTKRGLKGPRVLIRDRRRINQARTESARWPEEHMHEVIVPALNFILRGQADMRISDYSVYCWQDDIVFIPAGLPRSDGSVPDYVDITPSSLCDILLFSPGLVQGIGLECSIGHSRRNKHIAGSVDERCWVRSTLIAELYSKLCKELEYNGNSKNTYHLLMLLLIQLQQEIHNGNAMVGWPFSSLALPDVEEIFIRRAMKYINDHLEERLTINIVAREVGVSRTVFTREFRRSTGGTFQTYLTNQRMARAEVLLREVNLPVNRVSRDVGLSPNRLRGLFKQRHGCTPDKFRKL